MPDTTLGAGDTAVHKAGIPLPRGAYMLMGDGSE